MKEILVGMFVCLFIFVTPCFSSEKLPDHDLCTVTRVIDGDTVVGNCEFRGKQVIRLIGIDSFESRRYKRAYKQADKYGITIDGVIERGKQAKSITKKLLVNKRIILEFGDRKYGVYGRLLATIIFDDGQGWCNVNNFLLTEHSDVFFEYKR